jgi:hypothetical protein
MFASVLTGAVRPASPLTVARLTLRNSEKLRNFLSWGQ